MPSIKDLKAKQSNNNTSKPSSSGLWSMLDEFKSMIPPSQPNDHSNYVKNQLECNQDAIGVQSGCNQGAIEVQSGCNKTTDEVQLECNQGAIGVQSGCNQGANWSADQGANWSADQGAKKTSEKQNLVLIPSEFGEDFLATKMTGLHKEIMLCFLDLMEENKTTITPPINITVLAKHLNKPVNSVKSTIFRLKKLGAITSTSAKSGPSGFACYSVPEKIKKQLIESKYVLKTQHSLLGCNQGANWSADQGANWGATAPVVSSSYMNTTTTAETGMPENWQSLDLAPLEDIGFGQSQLIQIYREYEKNPKAALPLEEIQLSIYALAFDLKFNDASKDFKKPSAVVLLSLLKNGRPYSCKTPEKFVTPTDLARQKFIQAETNRKKRELEEIQQIKDVELKTWQNQLPEDELLEFCANETFGAGIPEKVLITLRRKKALELAEDYFNSAIWPQKWQTIKQTFHEQVTPNAKNDKEQELAEVEDSVTS